MHLFARPSCASIACFVGALTINTEFNSAVHAFQGSCGVIGGFYTNAPVFESHLAELGIQPTASWNFTPHDLPPSSSVLLNDPLTFNTHASNANDPWSNPGPNTWPAALNNIQFSSNMTPNGPLTPRGANGLTFANPDGNNRLSATVAADSLSIVCESPTNGRCQAMALFLSGPGNMRIRVYHSEGQYETYVNIAAGQQVFVGFIKTRIMRVDIWNSAGGENLASISAYRRPYPLDIAGNDGVVNVDDLLAVITAWGPCINCAADIAPPRGDDQVNVDDLLAIITAWGPVSPTTGKCFGENPSSGNCSTDDECFPGACDFAQCVPSVCLCIEGDDWLCTDDCCGRCN